MLVLTRKQNEKIRIGPSITITVLRMKGKAVRLGIEAPQDVSVIRGELCFELDENEIEESPVKRTKSRTSRSDVASEATGHWPLPSEGDHAVVMAGTCSKEEVAPLRAMLMARQR